MLCELDSEMNDNYDNWFKGFHHPRMAGDRPSKYAQCQASLRLCAAQTGLEIMAQTLHSPTAVPFPVDRARPCSLCHP